MNSAWRTLLPLLLLLPASCGDPRQDPGDEPVEASGRRRGDRTPDEAAPPIKYDGVAARLAGGTGACVKAKRLFSEDFETGDYKRWSGATYGNDWNEGKCHATALSELHAVSGTHSQRSEITCSYQTSPHRGYGGLQFSGDDVMPKYTNKGEGIDAPNGVVNTYWSWLEAPYPFVDGKWFSFFTINSACDYTETVVTLSLEDATNRIVPGHIQNTGGHTTFDRGATGFPMKQWVRTTIYLNYEKGEMVVWMNGKRQLRSTFTRPTHDLCQWHWGAYASGDNDQVVLFEDDISLWKLETPLADQTTEPWLGVAETPCP